MHVDEPRLGGLLLVLAVRHPVIAYLNVVLEIEQQVVAGHLTASEKVLIHPIARIPDLEGIPESMIGKYVATKQLCEAGAHSSARVPSFRRTQFGQTAGRLRNR